MKRRIYFNNVTEQNKVIAYPSSNESSVTMKYRRAEGREISDVSQLYPSSRNPSALNSNMEICRGATAEPAAISANKSIFGIGATEGPLRRKSAPKVTHTPSDSGDTGIPFGFIKISAPFNVRLDKFLKSYLSAAFHFGGTAVSASGRALRDRSRNEKDDLSRVEMRLSLNVPGDDDAEICVHNTAE